jgi:hypothetical protein
MSPNANLASPPGNPLRAKYLYWLLFGPGCVEPAMVHGRDQDRPHGLGIMCFTLQDKLPRNTEKRWCAAKLNLL